jgi:hypothetical protein
LVSASESIPEFVSASSKKEEKRSPWLDWGLKRDEKAFASQVNTLAESSHPTASIGTNYTIREEGLLRSICLALPSQT